MKTFLDNTSIHRINQVLNCPEAGAQVRRVDAFALLHLAEQIMFCEEMFVSSFEIPEIREKSAATISLLEQLGYLRGDGGALLLRIEDFSDEAYSTACRAAAPRILEDLQLLTPETIASRSKLADTATNPLGMEQSILTKWAAEDWPSKRRQALLQTSLAQKARGAFDFTIASNDALYQMVRALMRRERSQRRLNQVGLFFQVFFRVAINRELARQTGSIYSIAPQRAKVVNEVDQMFRHAVERRILDEARRDGRHLASKLLENMRSQEMLPLPMIAIHYLRAKKPNSPMALLEAARALRDEPDVKQLRKWLNQWEILFASPDMAQKEKARSKLYEIEADLKLGHDKPPLWSLLRPVVTVEPDSPSYSLDPSAIAQLIAQIKAWLAPRAIFFSALRKEFEYDTDIGADILLMLGRGLIE